MSVSDKEPLAGYTAVPDGIAAAWGLRERPTKGPKRGLSLAEIVAAGVKIAAADGLAAVSMARVAAEVGASTMSLYRYVRAKDELLALMVDAAYGQPPGTDPTAKPWRDGLVQFARAERAALLAHPWVMQIPLTGPPVTPNTMAWLEWGLTTMRDTGLPPYDKLEVMLLMTGFVRNEATMSSQIEAAQKAAGASNEEAMSGYHRLLKQLLDPRDFPEMTAVLDSGIFDQPDVPDYEFEFGLERTLDGIEALVRARGGPSAG
jgi:AcrR family transcriptional regulator